MQRGGRETCTRTHFEATSKIYYISLMTRTLTISNCFICNVLKESRCGCYNRSIIVYLYANGLKCVLG